MAEKKRAAMLGASGTRSASQLGQPRFMRPMPMRRSTVLPASRSAARARLGSEDGSERTVARNVLPSGWNVRALRTTPLMKPKKQAAVFAPRGGGPAPAALGAAAHHADRVHRKPPKSITEKASASGPGRISRYQRIAMITGTNGRSSSEAKANSWEFKRPLTM